MGTPIDCHVHPSTAEYRQGSIGTYMEDLCHHFLLDIPVRTVDEMAADYDGMRGVLLAWDAETATGRPPVTNDWVADVCRRYPERFIPFASVDPWKGDAAVAEARRAVRELGMKGFKFQQAAMAFVPSDERFSPLWEEISALGVGLPARLRAAHPHRHRGGQVPRPHDHLRPPGISVAARDERHSPPQGECLHRPVGVGAAVLSTGARSGGRRPAPGQDAVRY